MCLWQHKEKAQYRSAASFLRPSHRDRATGWRALFTPSLQGRSCVEAVDLKGFFALTDLGIDSKRATSSRPICSRSHTSFRSEAKSLTWKRKTAPYRFFFPSECVYVESNELPGLMLAASNGRFVNPNRALQVYEASLRSSPPAILQL